MAGASEHTKMIISKAISILDQHEQKREWSCIQSAVEMVLKLYGVIGIQEYPEQKHVQNDKKGYIPFEGKTKYYGKVKVGFREYKFPNREHAAIEKGLELLNSGIYPIYSFCLKNSGLHHGFVGIKDKMGEMVFLTKEVLGRGPAKKMHLLELWPHQLKTEILEVRIFQTKRNQ